MTTSNTTTMTTSAKTLASRMPDLSSAAALPSTFKHSGCVYQLEWYELDEYGKRGVVLYRYTPTMRFSWSVCLVVAGGESYASIVRRARQLRSETTVWVQVGRGKDALTTSTETSS